MRADIPTTSCSVWTDTIQNPISVGTAYCDSQANYYTCLFEGECNAMAPGTPAWKLRRVQGSITLFTIEVNYLPFQKGYNYLGSDNVALNRISYSCTKTVPDVLGCSFVEPGTLLADGRTNPWVSNKATPGLQEDLPLYTESECISLQDTNIVSGTYAVLFNDLICAKNRVWKCLNIFRGCSLEPTNP